MIRKLLFFLCVLMSLGAFYMLNQDFELRKVLVLCYVLFNMIHDIV